MTPITDRAAILGIDLGGTKIAYALGDARGGLHARHRRPTEPSGSPERDLARMIDDARTLVSEAGLAPGELAAVGLSVPGPIDLERGTLVNPPNLPGWGDVPIREAMESALGCPAHLENDANAAALAEWHFGAGQGSRHMVYLTMSTGVGGGLVLNGRIYRGVGVSAGEIGHIPIEWEGLPCACGQRGCLEAYVGGGSWIRRLAQRTPADSLVAELAGGPERARPEQVVEAARQGDAFALSEMARFNDYLARAIVFLGFTLAPEMVVLGTIAVAAGEELCLEPVRRQVRAHSWPLVAEHMAIRPASLGGDLPYRAGIGAALSGMEHDD
ncbi:MAG: ROK family protein [Myxococcota bacterium]